MRREPAQAKPDDWEAATASAPPLGWRARCHLPSVLALMVALALVSYLMFLATIQTSLLSMASHGHVLASAFRGTSGSALENSLALPPKRLAYVFYVTKDIYACATLHLIKQLTGTAAMDSSRIELVVLHTKDVTQQALQRLPGVRLVEVDTMLADASEPTWKESLTKLQVFREWGYDRVVYLDADAVPLQNLDHLFDLPPASLYAPTAYWLAQPFFASTLLVIEPSDALFDDLVHWARSRGSSAGFDMDILNSFFKDSVQYLPGDYTVLNSDFRAPPDAKNKLYNSTSKLKQHTKLVHFSCKPDGSYGKPWSLGRQDMAFAKAESFDPLFAELFEGFWTTQENEC